jgi:hypothetical protein
MLAVIVPQPHASYSGANTTAAIATGTAKGTTTADARAGIAAENAATAATAMTAAVVTGRVTAVVTDQTRTVTETGEEREIQRGTTAGRGEHATTGGRRRLFCSK